MKTIGLLDTPGEEHIEINGDTYYREEWDRRKKVMEEYQESREKGVFVPDDTKILKKDGYYILYVND